MSHYNHYKLPIIKYTNAIPHSKHYKLHTYHILTLYHILLTFHFALPTIHRTRCTVLYTFIMHHTLYATHFGPHTLDHTLWTTHFGPHTVHYTLCITDYTPHIIHHYTLYTTPLCKPTYQT